MADAVHTVMNRFGCPAEEAESLMIRCSATLETKLDRVAQDLVSDPQRAAILDSIRDARESD